MRIADGTRALITGPSRGIGRALASELARRGATLGLASRSAAELEVLARELPGEHHVLPCDVGDAAQVQGAVETLIDRAGGLDLVVANAGIAKYGPFHAQSLEDVEAMTRINWLGTLYTVHAALPHLLGRAEGHIVIISSAAGWRAFPWAAGYGASKAAQRAFGEGLWHELSGSGVELTTVFPGEVQSSLHDDQAMSPDWQELEDRAPVEGLVAAIIKGVEAGDRHVFWPRNTRLLAALHGLSPTAADALLRRVKGRSAAPRRS